MNMYWGEDPDDLDNTGGFGNGFGNRYEHDDSHLAQRSYDYIHSYRYEFDTEEQLITSKVFQDQLAKALAFKDRVIAELQQELINCS